METPSTLLSAASPNSSPTPSPYITAPSSPIHLADVESHRSSMAFDWDQKTPKSFNGDGSEDQEYGDDDDITFEFCVDQFHSFSLPAEELFDDGKIRTLKPPPPVQLGDERTSSPPLSIPPQGSRRQITWSSRRSYDFSYPFLEASKAHQLRRNQRDKSASFGGSSKTSTSSRFNKLINVLTFRRPSSSSDRGSSTSFTKTSTSFGSTGSSSSGSGLGVRYLPAGSDQEPGDDGYGVTLIRDEGNSCLTPCKNRILSCFVKKL